MCLCFRLLLPSPVFSVLFCVFSPPPTPLHLHLAPPVSDPPLHIEFCDLLALLILTGFALWMIKACFEPSAVFEVAGRIDVGGGAVVQRWNLGLSRAGALFSNVTIKD